MSQGLIGSDANPVRQAVESRKKRISRGRKLTNFDLERLRKMLRTVLGREILSLMDGSYRKRLHPKAAEMLVKYTRLVAELQTYEAEKLKGMSKEELEAFVKRNERAPRKPRTKNLSINTQINPPTQEDPQ